ncbi:hypothetical protein TIFTF001_041392 [Ficus carica]|uniref:Reverse transcriptase zinc-binding domain-containing protein n=1 Tax=Ficus carica TaxID=3494 RepID=A0AA87ZNX0_FICCA|nr:hypothetical protein TIFTF001_041392 [Ficus carica]
MWYPDEEIPKWFNFQTEGRSIKVRFPHDQPKSFLGFAFCFIVKDAEWQRGIDFVEYLRCEINVRTIVGNRCRVVSERFHLENRKSLHVLMTTFISKESFFLDREISFDIISGTQAEMKRFGVRILRVEDAIDFGIISGQSNDVTNKGKQRRFQKSTLKLLHYLKVSPSGKELCEKIWSSNLDDRYKILWWQLVRDVLPVRAVLNDVGDTRCPLCGLGLETATHLFLFCDRVRPLWFMSKWGLPTDSILCDSMASFLEIVLHGDPNSNVYEEFLVYASLLVDTIWCARNQLVYQGKEFHIPDICSFLQAQFEKIISSLRHSRKQKERPWTKTELLFEAQKEVSAKRLQTDASVLMDENQPMTMEQWLSLGDVGSLNLWMKTNQ